LSDVTKYLAIDYGDVRAGIAISDENKKYSFSRDYISNNDQLLNQILKLIKEENISKIIIGYPLNLKSGKSQQTFKVEEFRNKLKEFLDKNSIYPELIFFDERLTSSLAKTNIISSGLRRSKRRQKGMIDSLAAQIILQDYIDKEIKFK
jgi:putative holliday junction resolvase